MASKAAWARLYLLALCCVCVAVEVAAQRAQPRHKRRKRKMGDSKMQSFFGMFKFVYAAVLIPLGAFLLYAILRDPVTPHLAKEIWYRIQEAATGQKIVIDENGKAKAVPRAAPDSEQAAGGASAAPKPHQA